MGITILAFALSVALAAPFSASTSAIFSSPEKNDFTLSDIYAQIANDRAVRKLDDRIAILDIGHGGREEIAEMLEILTLCGPSAIGLDVNFEEARENDNRLLNAISNAPELVLPLGVTAIGNSFKISDKPFFYDSIKNPSYGVINLTTLSGKGNIREFTVNFPMANGEESPSFVTALLGKIAPDIKDELLRRGRRNEISAYHSREYNIYDLNDLLEAPEKFTDKVVLIGALDDASDMHATPINSYMPGVMIHAHALSTALDRDWYISLPKWADYLIAFVLCFLIILATVGIRNGIRGLLVRILQVILAYAAVRIVYSLFIDNHVICNFSTTLLMIAFGLFAVDIWNGIASLINLTSRQIKSLKNKKNKNLTCENLF